jgi:hypothetical protein
MEDKIYIPFMGKHLYMFLVAESGFKSLPNIRSSAPAPNSAAF